MTATLITGLLTGLLLVAGLAAPAAADRESVCLRLDPEGGRDGVCVWVPVP